MRVERRQTSRTCRSSDGDAPDRLREHRQDITGRRRFRRFARTSDASGGADAVLPIGAAEAPALRDAATTRAPRSRSAARVVERADGAVIVVDREYRADMLHGRTPIGEIVSTITEGDERHAADGEGVAIRRRRASDGRAAVSSISRRPGCPAAPARRRFWSAAPSIEGDAIRVRQFLMPGFEHERALLSELRRGRSRTAPCHLQRPHLRCAADRNPIHVPPRAVPAGRRAAPRHAASGAAAVAAAAAGRRARRSG